MATTTNAMSLTMRLQTALSKPLYQRCPEVDQILNETSIKDLHTIYPFLLEHLFGFGSQPGWGVQKVLKGQYQDYTVLKQFVSPTGPLMKLVYKLQADSYLRYEFPISCLPAPTRRMIEEGAIPILYVNKLQFQSHGCPHNMLSLMFLDAFEFYLFHFAYCLVSSQHQKTSSWSNPYDALFPAVLEEYMNHFLPIDGKPLAPMPSFQAPVRSPIAHPSSPLYSRQSPSSVGKHSPPHQSKSFLGLLRSQTQLQRSISQQSTTILDQTEHETWRSEALVQILAEFWLNQNSLDSDKHGISQQAASFSGNFFWRSPLGQYWSTPDPFYSIFAEHFLPSGDHVRVVRMLVKHLHFFSCSALNEVVSSPYQQASRTALDDFKRSVIPQLIQKKLYAFLRHSFDRWPLDSSFRLMLECWLSFIQPWRYTDPTTQTARERHDSDVKVKAVDPKWQNFITDNLLFYTVLFQEFLPRVFRMDLSSAKNAYMMFRVTKVFGLPNLAELIHNAECVLFDSRHTLGHRMSSHDVGSSYLAPSPSNMAAILNLHFAELEGPGFQYKPMFGLECKRSVEQLLGIISQAKTTATCSQKSSENGSSSFFSFLGLGPSADYNTWPVATGGYDDYAGSDSRKIEAHLEQSALNLARIFDVHTQDTVDGIGRTPTIGWGSPGSPASSPDTSLLPDHLDTPDGPVLTPLGRYQMMNGLKKFNVRYQGDPDLQPVRTYECAFLVRCLYQLSLFINQKFSTEIQHLYDRDDFVGRVASQYLSPPFRASATKTLSPRLLSPQQHHGDIQHHARLSLRFLASYQNIGYLGVFFMVLYLWRGTGPMGFVFILLLLALLYGMVRALLAPRHKIKAN